MSSVMRMWKTKIAVIARRIPYLAIVFRKYRTFQRSSRADRVKLLVSKVPNSFHSKDTRVNLTGGNLNPVINTILGHKVPTSRGWNDKRKLVKEVLENRTLTSEKKGFLWSSTSDTPMVAILISLYRSEAYLEKFLHNLREQTLFMISEPCLILVDPSPTELDLVTNFCKHFPNSKFAIVEKRISIYQAWNIAIKMTKAPYLTNMNVDDSRRFDSLQIQLETFYQHPWVDVVYQDFFFTLEPHLNWQLIEEMGFKTNLPPVTLIDLVLFGINSPHNGPMWRRDLHSELGLFNESLKSAGDYEFWITCAAGGKNFFKSADAHLSYYVNPHGMSTTAMSPSTSEEKMIQDEWKTNYKKQLKTFEYKTTISLPETNADIKLLQLYLDSLAALEPYET